MAKKETSIFFVREKDNLNKSFVTLELQDQKIIQVRAKNNNEPPEQVKRFIKQWETKFQLSGY